MTLLVRLRARFHIWPKGWKLKMAQNGHKLRFYGLLGVLNKLLAFSYTGETDYDKTLFLKYCQARQRSVSIKLQDKFMSLYGNTNSSYHYLLEKATKTLEICWNKAYNKAMSIKLWKFMKCWKYSNQWLI